MRKLSVNALHTFPSPCAKRAAIAAGEVASGAVPAHLQDGLPDADGVIVDEVFIDHHSVSIRTVQVAPDRAPEDRPFMRIRVEYDDLVVFDGYEAGWSYSYDQYSSPRLTVQRDGDYDPQQEPIDLGDRDFIPRLHAWAESCGVEASPAIVATAQAAARDGVS